MLIDFKEIPKSNQDGNTQDIFEKFCRDFLEIMDYDIISGPARGADGGLDIKVCETRKGVGGMTKIYWLVSCKHYAHSGKSITKEMEIDIRDRTEKNDCQGFIGLYTTIANQSLSNSLIGLAGKIEYQLFDNEKIEKHLIGIHSYEKLLLRYFPLSYKKWQDLYYYTEPIKLFDKYLENNHKYKKDFLLNIFHSTGNLIKQIRNHSDFSSALISENLTLLIIDEFSNDLWKNEAMGNLIHSKIPNLVKTSFGYEIGGNVISLSFDADFKLSYVHYPNYLLISSKYKIDLDKLFLELKDILN